MNKQLLKLISELKVGDLIHVQWSDASIGKSLQSGSIDVPVYSYGLYLGCLGDKKKHIILAQNSFRYANGFYDIDYTAIPVDWSLHIRVVKQGEVDEETANSLLRSFLQGNNRTLKRRLRNHDS